MIAAVVCVLKSGGLYDPSWVDKLHSGVIKWWPRQVPRFICLTDMEFEIDGVECVPLAHAWPGYWSKIELFGPALPKIGLQARLLFLDLDTVIVGPLDKLLAFNATFAALREPSTNAVGSGIMLFSNSWRMTVGKRIFREMAEQPAFTMDRCQNGDMQLISDHVCDLTPDGIKLAGRWLQDYAPGLAVSYKNECGEGGARLSPDASIVYFHGTPKPCDLLESDPVRKAWEAT